MCPRYFDKQGNALDVSQWLKRLEDPSYKIVKQTTLPNGKFISTVWLGLCHTFNPDHTDHLIFETMMFPKENVDDETDQEIYSTEEEALNGHYKMCLKYSPLKASNNSTIQKKKHPKQMNKKPAKKISKKK